MHTGLLLLISRLLYPLGLISIGGGFIWGVGGATAAFWFYGGWGIFCFFVGFLFDVQREILQRLQNIEEQLSVSYPKPLTLD